LDSSGPVYSVVPRRPGRKEEEFIQKKKRKEEEEVKRRDGKKGRNASRDGLAMALKIWQGGLVRTTAPSV